MAIVPLNKMTLYGAESRRQVVIERLQDLGCVHLVDLGHDPSGDTVTDASRETREALQYLRACPEQLWKVRRRDGFDRAKVVAEALHLRNQGQERRDERDELQKAIELIEPWGEFRLPDGDTIGNIRLWFYVVPLRAVDSIQAVEAPAREVTRDHQHAYYVVLKRDGTERDAGHAHPI